MRFIVTASCAVLALGVAAATFAGAAEKPAATASPFVGSYAGYLPGSSGGYLVTISANGKVAGTGSGVTYGFYWSGEASGGVREGGRLSVHGTETRSPHYDEPGPAYSWKSSFHGKAMMVKNEDGSLSGVADDGTTFVWSPYP